MSRYISESDFEAVERERDYRDAILTLEDIMGWSEYEGSFWDAAAARRNENDYWASVEYDETHPEG